MKILTILIFLMVLTISSYGFELKPVSEISATSFRVWDVSKGPINVSVNSTGSDDLPLSSVEAEIQSAINRWQKVTGSIRLHYAGIQSGLTVNSTDQINSILFVEKNWEYSSSVLAITKYTYVMETPPHMIDADIVFNGKDWRWGSGFTSNVDLVDLQQVALHELGHLLGLSHTSVYNAALYPFLPEKVEHKLRTDDKAGVRFLYDRPSAGFVPATPVDGAPYVKGISEHNLPLPIFSWYGTAYSNFALEFSDSLSFVNKITVPVGANTFYALSISDEKKLSAMAQKIFWRVASGSVTTKPRAFRFKPIL
jgi:matrixin